MEREIFDRCRRDGPSIIRGLRPSQVITSFSLLEEESVVGVVELPAFFLNDDGAAAVVCAARGDDVPRVVVPPPPPPRLSKLSNPNMIMTMALCVCVCVCFVCA